MTMENIIRMAIEFEGRTAFPVSEYDRRPLELLMSAAELARARRRQEPEGHVPQGAFDLLGEMESVWEKAADQEPFDQVRQLLDQVRSIAYGGRKESNLDQYGYDMVFGATLGSIDAVMKEYLDKASDKIKTQTKYYIEAQEGGKVVYREASEETAKRLDELDIFSISEDAGSWTPEQKAALDEAYNDLLLAFGFKAAIGLPPSADVGNILDFDTGETGNHTKVKYNMYFRELSIIQFATSRTGGYIFTNLSQPDNTPWVFNYTVDLGMVGVSLDALPENIRKKVNNIDPGQIFSISQLFMDLNTTALMSSPTITGLDPNTTYYLETYFLKYIFARMKETSGDVIFGYSIMPKSIPSYKPYLLTPKDFRFYVSPYYENGQPAPAKKKLYTLNYIVICENKPFPELRQIKWNWVSQGEYAQKNGVVAISSSQIYKFAQNEYIRLVRNLLFNVVAEIDIPNPIYIYWRLGVIPNRSVTPEFDASRTYTYNSSAEQSDYFIPIWGDVHMTYDLKAVLRHYQTEDNRSVLECRIDTVCWLHVNAVGGVSEGNVYNKTTYYTLTINVDEYGKLTLTPGYSEVDNGTTFDISGWSSFWVCGLEDYLNEIKTSINSSITNNKDYWNQSFLNRYNGNAFWYLPGDGSLIFRKPLFSNNQDLTFDANYATPTTSEKKGVCHDE